MKDEKKSILPKIIVFISMVLVSMGIVAIFYFNIGDIKGKVVNPTLKKKWIKIFIEQGERKKRTFYERFLGKDEEVLFEQKNKEQNWTGYTPNYMSIEVQDNNDLKNKIKKVKLTAIKNGNLTGELQNYKNTGKDKSN